MSRLINRALMMVLVVVILIIIFMAMPIMPRLRREQNDSLATMSFYIIVTLAIIVSLFYWGNLNV